MILALLASLAPVCQLPVPLLNEPRGPVDCPDGWYDGTVGIGLSQLVGSGDFDGDSDVDLYWWGLHRNSGEGRFERATGSALAFGPAYAFLEVFDVEGDGDLDLLTGLHLTLQRNDGSGGFSKETIATTPGGTDVTFSYASRADFNQDGTQDFAFASESEDYFPPATFDRVGVWLSNAAGGWTEKTSAGILGPTTTFDWDKDGLVDLIGWDIADARWEVQRSLGNGTFQKLTSKPTGLPANGWAHLPADYDGDGDVDLFVGSNFFRSFPPQGSDLYLDDGTGAFVAGPPLPAGTTRVVSRCDLDGDAAPDLIGFGPTGIQGLQNDGTGTFSTLFVVPVGSDAQTVDYVDVDGDGDGDLVVSGYPEVSVFQQTSPYVFVEDHADQSARGATSHLALGDLDGDGDPDAYLGGADFYVNDGTGYLTRDPSRKVGAWGRTLGSKVFLDHDGDGDLDILATDLATKLLVNDGTGHFSLAAVFDTPLLPELPWWIEAADLSGDGLDDVVLVYDGSPDVVEIWENAGGGTFLLRGHTITPAGSVRQISLGDIDGDLDLDLLAANGVWLNQGWSATDPLLFSAAALPAGFRAEVLADADGDGDLDALTGGGMYANDGSGNFADLPAPSSGTCHAAGDLDGDGDLDLLIAGSLGPRLYWEENDGSGSFSLGGTTDPSAGGTRLFSSCAMPYTNYLNREPRLIDIDLDGDADLLWGDDRLYLYSNLTRGTYVEGISGPGHDLVVDVYGPPGELWLLAFAEQTKATMLPQGRLFLKLATWIAPLYRTGTMDASGRTRVSFSVPNVLALQGTSYVTQGLVGVPLRFTNADWFTFDDR